MRTYLYAKWDDDVHYHMVPTKNFGNTNETTMLCGARRLVQDLFRLYPTNLTMNPRTTVCHDCREYYKALLDEAMGDSP